MEKASSSLSGSSNNSTSNKGGYSTSPMKKYWCHLCQKDFSKIYIKNIDIQCSYCGNTFCEELNNNDINSDSHPSHFQPFVLNHSSPLIRNNIRNNNSNNNNNNNNNSNIYIRHGRLMDQIINARNIIRPRNSSNLLDLIMNFIMIQNYNDDLENIINHLMMTDTNKYGNPPAAEKAIEKLEKCKIDEIKLKEFGFENLCAICKEEFIINEDCLLMPCHHHFHRVCLLPWLKERNTCPVCRYELPTDDEDFEQRKKQKINNTNILNSNNGNNLNINTNTSTNTNTNINTIGNNIG